MSTADCCPNDRTWLTSCSRNNFSFKCHRKDQTPSAKDQSLVYAVNDISFHPVHGTFSTCGKLAIVSMGHSHRAKGDPGSDGTIHYWDKDARTRLKCACVHSLDRMPIWLR